MKKLKNTLKSPKLAQTDKVERRIQKAQKEIDLTKAKKIARSAERE